MIDVVIPTETVTEARESNWGEDFKNKHWAETDDKSVGKTKKDVIIGNLGESAASICLKSYGIRCAEPDFSTKEKGSEIWNDDIRLEDDCDLNHPVRGVVSLDRYLIVKAQSSSQAARFGASWTFQLSTKKRHQDPHIDKDSPTLMFGVLIDDSECHASVYVFYWPDVRCYLRDPAIPRLRNCKRCLYLDDILEKEQPLDNTVLRVNNLVY